MKKHPNRIKLLIISILTLTSFTTTAQMLEPVKWTTRVDVSEDGYATLVAIANIEKGWHVYSQYIDDGGPIKTTFTFVPSEQYTLEGKVEEGEAEDFYDKNFEMQLSYFSDIAEFKQRIKLNSSEAFKVGGTVEFMVCDDEKCLPPNGVDLVFNIIM